MKTDNQTDYMDGVVTELGRRARAATEIRIKADKARKLGRRWVDVRSLRLVEGRDYWVRRTFLSVPQGPPVLTTWTSWGWRGDHWGALNVSTSTQAGIEVWVW